MVVGLVTVNRRAVVGPNLTEVVLVRLVPVKVTKDSPRDEPLVGEKLVKVGGTAKVKVFPSDVKVPVGVTTKILTEPAGWALVTAVMVVWFVTENRVAGVVPNITAVAPTKWFPEMVTTVPPATGPPRGETLEMHPPRRRTKAARPRAPRNTLR